MDAQKFDAFSKNLALAANRRAIVRGSAGGGLLALFGMLIGRNRVAQAREEPVVCEWEIEAQGAVGPNSFKTYNGILNLTIQPDGAIDAGSYTLVDAAWNPLLDSHGDPIVFGVLGSSYIRAIDFR